jgi:hypothetical protein
MTKKLLFSVTVVLLVAAGLNAQEAKSKVSLKRLEGWIVDAKKGKEHANAESKAAVLENHEKGSPLVFVTEGGEVYRLDDRDQAMALEKVGEKVAILGTRGEDGYLKIGSFMRPKKKKKPEPEQAPEAEAPAEDDG